MSDKKVDFNAYKGKRIRFTYTPPKRSADEEVRQHEGVVEMVNAASGALLIKERGVVVMRLIEIDGIDLDSLRLIEEAPRELKQKKLDPVTLSGARFHLLDRHGWGLVAINQLPDEDAFEIHKKMDHVDDGHFHTVREI